LPGPPRDERSERWSRTDAPLSADSIHALVVRRAARAGLSGVTPHTLRRTYATKLKDVGVTLDTIQRYLGHASISTTTGYFAPRDERAVGLVRDLNYGGRPDTGA
jgi:site-specific recombinase XerD